MEFLKFLENLRTPFFDDFFSFITKFGEETALIFLGLFFFWCVNKRHGYYIMFVGFLGTILNMFLKIVFRIPRPWVSNPEFTIVESARAEAVGYSFPSGHTQVSVGVFGCIAKAVRHSLVRVVCLTLCILVPFSRMYLGVHTPLDVFVSVALALLLIFVFYPVIYKATDNTRDMRLLFGGILGIALAYLIFVELFPFPADIDTHNYEAGLSNGYKICGCMAGLWLGFELDTRYINFDTKATWYVQILKLVIGIIPVLLIKTFLKEPLQSAFGYAYLGDAARYFLITFFASGIWPFTFKFFSRL